MNFKGHLTSGLATGAIVVGVSWASGYASIDSSAVRGFCENPWSLENDVSVLVALFLTTAFMSLFPDLDIGSVPQRWFLRGAFIALAVLFYYGETKLFAALTFTVLLPMLHKHRGWTHFKSTPFFILLAAVVIYEYDRGIAPEYFSLNEAIAIFKRGWPYALACVSGHYTHLLLDYLPGRRFV